MRRIRRPALLASSGLEAGSTKMECKLQSTLPALAGSAAVTLPLPARRHVLTAEEGVGKSMMGSVGSFVATNLAPGKKID